MKAISPSALQQSHLPCNDREPRNGLAKWKQRGASKYAAINFPLSFFFFSENNTCKIWLQLFRDGDHNRLERIPQHLLFGRQLLRQGIEAEIVHPAYSAFEPEAEWRVCLLHVLTSIFRMGWEDCPLESLLLICGQPCTG